MTTIVFLHIPKTAGQTVHNAIASKFKPDDISPIRVHTQARGGRQMPPGYKFYSGHLDWTELTELPSRRFTFTILRDPKERIASFYFYLLKEADSLSVEELQKQENIGKRRALEWSADDYFFGGDGSWKSFILDHYDNFYCSYFATRKMRGRSEVASLPLSDLLRLAKDGAAKIDAIYQLSALGALERDLQEILNSPIRLTDTIANRGPLAPDVRRWPKLLECFERDADARRLESFVTNDEALVNMIERGR